MFFSSNFRMLGIYYIVYYKDVIMSYDEKKYLEDHKKTWKGFVDYSIRGCIIITVVLVLMSIFLTG